MAAINNHVACLMAANNEIMAIGNVGGYGNEMA